MGTIRSANRRHQRVIVTSNARRKLTTPAPVEATEPKKPVT